MMTNRDDPNVDELLRTSFSDRGFSDEASVVLVNQVRPVAIRALMERLRIPESDAADAFDEAVLQVISKGSLHDVRSPIALLNTIATRRAVDAIRKRTRERENIPPEPFSEWSSSQKLSVYDAIMQLPNPERVVLALKYHLGWTVREIADALNMPKSTVFEKMSAGLRTVEKLL